MKKVLCVLPDDCNWQSYRSGRWEIKSGPTHGEICTVTGMAVAPDDKRGHLCYILAEWDDKEGYFYRCFIPVPGENEKEEEVELVEEELNA